MKTDPRWNNLLNTAMADLSEIVMKRVLETYKGFEGVSLLVALGQPSTGSFPCTLPLKASTLICLK